MSNEQPGKRVTASPLSSGQQIAGDPTLATRRLQNITQFSGRGTTHAYNGQTTPVSDPLGNLSGFKLGAQDTGRLCLGWIMDGTSIANCYRVHVEKSVAPLLATACSHTSQVCFGASAINTYAPGTQVIVAVHDKQRRGVILGAIPSILDIGKHAYHDYISQASRKRVDDVHKKYIKQQDGGQIADYSAWRPYDATLAGEWGAITTTGAAVTLDDFMVRMSINEFCGVYGFYHDQLLRVAGYNMQLWTAGHERDAYMDQAEYNDTQGYSPYPWEAMGLLIPGGMIEEYQAADYQCSKAKPYYAHWENKHEFQQPYHRTQHFFGYLGQGNRQVVHAPPQGKKRWTYDGKVKGPGAPPYDSGIKSECGGGATKEVDHDPKPAYGLKEENTAQDGRTFIASAKGIVITKRMLLPMPQRVKRPEDYKEGDEAEKNYKAASKYGAGPEHKITGDIKTTDTQWPHLQRASAIQDLHGYLFNYAGLHPFYWHAKDYKMWEQSELEYAEVNQRIPEFPSLMGSMYLPQIGPRKLKIDHRYDTQDFYETESFVSLLEDGGVVIADGYGAEIRMSAGCVFISAPGDVWLKGGRDVQTWAGNDAIIRANKTVDISATEKNVRIKAERNVLVFAGNETSDRDGGILLESRGKTIEYDFDDCGDKIRFAGVVLRAPHSNVVGLAHQIYMRTGGGEIKPGDIVLDAARGDKDIITKSKNIFNYVNEKGAVYQFFGDVQGGFTSRSNMFKEDVTLLCGPIGTEGSIFVNGDVLCNGKLGFLAANGHVITKKAAEGAIYVAPCDDECNQKVEEALNMFSELIEETVPDMGDEINNVKLEALWYENKRAGNDDTINKMQFSFRKDDDYKIPDFALFEDRWQQMARIGAKEPKKWTERPVSNAVCSATYPFPGKKWLVDEPAYSEQDLDIVENVGGYRDKDRGKAPGLVGAYANPKFKTPGGRKILNGIYPIIPRT